MEMNVTLLSHFIMDDNPTLATTWCNIGAFGPSALYFRRSIVLRFGGYHAISPSGMRFDVGCPVTRFYKMKCPCVQKNVSFEEHPSTPHDL